MAEIDNLAAALGLELADLESRMVQSLELHTATAIETLRGALQLHTVDAMEATRAGVLGTIVDDLNDLETRVSSELENVQARLASGLQDHTAQTLERLAAEIAALPAPEPGQPGRDGVDRILALPRYVRAGESCAANEVAWHKGGIWQSVRVTSGNPDDDPPGWQCLVPGVTSFEAREDWQTREIIFAARMSDGALHECRGRMPATALPADYLDRGWGVLAGDTWRSPDGEVQLEALRDGAALGVPEHWRETRLRGFRGQKGLKGDKGDRGAPGPGLVGMDLVRSDAGLAIVPRYADPAVTPEPIAVQLLTADPEPGRQVIAAFAGSWDAGRTYRRGDAVRANVAGRDRLVLSIKSDNNAAPHDGAAWLVMV